MSEQEHQYSEAQLAVKEKIEQHGMVAGAIAGVVVGVIAWFCLSASFPVLTYLFVPVLAFCGYFLVSVIYIHLKASGAKCASCQAEFSVVHQHQDRKFLHATPRREEQSNGTVWYESSRKGKEEVKVTTYTEEKYEVTDTYLCQSCGSGFEKKNIETKKTNSHTNTLYR